MNKTRTGFARRIRRGLLALAMTAGVVGGATVATTSPAIAENNYTVYYPAESYKVCRHQGHTGATSLDWGNPYSLTCYDLSIPAGITFAGDLDIQGYCNDKYPGSVAVVDGTTIFDWKCKRVEDPPTS